MNEADPEMIKDPEVAQLDKNEELKCRYCDFRMNLSAEITNHSLIHNSERLQCQHCDYTAT